MSQTDLENFQRLEEFPSYISCIRSFGRSIIPPLVTPNHAHELRQLHVAAISKEAEILRRKKRLREIKGDHTLSMLLENDHKLNFQSSIQESCALWYPSYLDNQEVSVAISKFPTSGIYSSVHTDAIVCSNVIGSNHAYNSNIVKNVLIDSGSNITDCVECSHSNVNLECSLCLEEWNQNLCSKSFPADLSPEVPCRSFSLLQHSDVSAMEGELNTTMEETECESLPTVICNQNQKNIHPDTDSESNTTCMTQSTDLEKYMELSCEFSSPDNSAVVWDSKTASQQCTLSRSDDASSETIVNTEHELTPCASTMAELTDNMEDEFSNAEEVAGASDNKEVSTGAMKRAHSVDSYMRILQNSGKNLNVKKSQSEPFTTNKVSNSPDMNDKTNITSKNNLLIKEDSKESEEANDIPEKDDYAQKNGEVSIKNDKATELESNKNSSFKKKHVRRNSYTLDHPSSALILAHADCTCNFDAKCISPHCSALKDTSEVICYSAFVKEKVDISTSHPQLKMLPILNSDKPSKGSNFNKEEISSTVVDIFPNVNEDSCEKSDSGNTKISMNTGASDIKDDLKVDAERYLSKCFLENLNPSNQAKHQEYIQNICEELKASHEQRVKELREEQSRQWLKLEEEFKVQETLLYEKLKITLESSRGLSSKNEDELMKSNLSCCNEDKVSEDVSSWQNELPVSNSSGSLSDQISTFDSCSSTQTSTLSIPNKGSPSSLSPSEISVLPENARALSPSRERWSSDKNPPIPSEDIKKQQLLENSNVSIACLKNNEDPVYITRESMSDVNGFSHPSSFVPHFNSLPKYPSAIAVPIYNNCDKIATCFCDNTFELCRCCVSFNGYSEYDNNSSRPYCTLSSREQDSVSFDGSTSNQSDNLAFKKLSACSGIQNRRMESADLDNSKISIPDLPMRTNDCISTTQNDALTLIENGELSNVKQDDKDKRSSLPLSTKGKSPIDNLVALYAKSSKNGACIPHNAPLNNKMNIDPKLMKKFEKLPAFVKGYLTRCLLKTKHVQNLIKTFKDTVLLLGRMRDDLTSKGDSVSQGDVDFHRQLIVLLMTTYDNFYDTFFTISTKERMNIIAESRLIKCKQKSICQEQELPPVTTKAAVSAACKTHKLSSATPKALERKKRPTIDGRTYNVEDMRKARSRSVLDMRTYTIDDLPNFSGRTQSSMSSKNVSVSPSSIYKSSVGTSLKRKTSSTKSSGSRGCVHQKWVP